MSIEININDYVSVTLTESGARIWNEYEMGFAKYNIPGWEPRLKKEGDVHRDSLWHMMQLFGPHIHLGGEVPFVMCRMTIEEGKNA